MEIRWRAWVDTDEEPESSSGTYFHTEVFDSLDGEQAAAHVMRQAASAREDVWDCRVYIMEIVVPLHIAGRYAVEISYEPTASARRLHDAARLVTQARRPDVTDEHALKDGLSVTRDSQSAAKIEAEERAEFERLKAKFG